MKKKRMLYLRAVAWALLGLVIALDILFFATGTRDYSPTENRNLQAFPALSVRTLASGRFESQFDDFVADQFPLRDGWIRIKAAADRLLGRVESNRVFLARDGYLIQNFTEPDAVNYAETIAALRDFSARHPDVAQYLLLAPSALSGYREKLPRNAVAGDEGGYIDRLAADLSGTAVRFIDVRPAFAAAKDTQLYYRTDHHWTTDGARIAFDRAAEAMGMDTGAWRRTLLSDSFSGTLTASSGFRMSETDPLVAFLPESPVDYVVNYVEEGERRSSVYRTENLAARDQYTVFFGGNHAEVKLETATDGRRAVMVIKDSYANCFVPFMIPACRKIVMIDPRYFTGDIDALIEAEGVTDILFLYNANTLASDTALKRDIGR